MAQAKETLGIGDASKSDAGKIGGGKQARRKPAGKSGTERLRSLADRQLSRNLKELTEVLTRKALAGSVASTRVLVELAQRKKPEAVKRRGLSEAERLANEPEWDGPEEEGDEIGSCE
jgi:hypothetical protein